MSELTDDIIKTTESSGCRTLSCWAIQIVGKGTLFGSQQFGHIPGGYPAIFHKRKLAVEMLCRCFLPGDAVVVKMTTKLEWNVK